MISVPAGVRVWLASGATDMRRGMNSLALQVQQVLGRNPHGGDVFVFRGKRGDLLKVLWADGIGMSLYLKRLERGRFIWPALVGGVVPITGSQPTCSMASTGDCLSTLGGRRQRDSCGRLNRR